MPEKQKKTLSVSYVLGDSPEASIWRLKIDYATGKIGEFKPIAQGLRNSLAIAVHPRSGLIIQGENNIDKWARHMVPDHPPDELNIIHDGKNYGWPYCVGKGIIVPGYKRKGISCKHFTSPAILLPAHSAPLGLLFYKSNRLPALEGKLLAAFHGSRRNGHRMVAYDIDASGLPTKGNNKRAAPYLPVIDNWVFSRDIRPIGRPVSLIQASDGSVWFLDDKSASILRLDRVSESNNP